MAYADYNGTMQPGAAPECSSATLDGPETRAVGATLWNAPARIGTAVFRFLVEWQRRHDDRARLMVMDRRQLDDIGVTPSQAWEEARKPFWLP